MSENTFNIELPDGRVLEGVPVGTTKAEIAAKLGIKSESTFAEVGRVADKSIRGGLLAVPELIAMLAKYARKGGEWAAGKLGARPEDMATPSKLESFPTAIKAMTGGDIAVPQTTIGKYLGAAGEGAVAALAGPGGMTNLARNAVMGGAAGGGSELSANLFGDNALSRALGALAGGGTTAVVSSVVPNSTKLVKQAISQMPEADWRRAKVLESLMEKFDISHLKSQLLGPASTLDDLAAVAGSHPSVRPQLLGAVKNSPEEARKAFEVWSAENLPPNISSRRSILEDVQGVASGTIDGLKRTANTRYVQALPEGVSTDTYGKSFIDTLRGEFSKLVKDPDKYGPNTAGGQAITKFMENHLPELKPFQTVKKGYINNLVKDLNTIAEKEGYKGLPVKDIKGILKDFTVDDFGAAREAKTTFMRESVNPVEKGLAGQLAQMGGGVKPDKFTAKESALKLVFPDKTPQPQEIIRLGNDLGADSVGQLLREHLATNMEHAVRLSKNEATALQAPFEFLSKIAGTNAQRQNVEAALQVIAKDAKANPAAVRNGFYKLMKAFETTKDLKLPANVDRATLAQQAGLNTPGLLVAPQSRMGRYLWERMTEKTYKKIAEIITSKDGLKQLEQIAKAPDNKAGMALARSIFATSLEDESGEPKPTGIIPE